MKEAHAKALAELEAAHSKELREYDMKALVEVCVSVTIVNAYMLLFDMLRNMRSRSF